MGYGIDRFRAEPETQSHLIIEGAGGLVPLNEEDTMFDIIMPNYSSCGIRHC
jgi:dethiobiotin synthetase